MTTSAKPTAWGLVLALIAVLAGGALYYAFGLSGPANGSVSRVEAAKTLLQDVRVSREVPTPSGVTAPLPDVRDPETRKALFIAGMLPLIVRENERIARQRERAKAAEPGGAQYAALAHAYDLPPDATRDALLRRIDIVPASLALAQGAIESGWGTSRFAREGNAYFGQRTYDDDAPGLSPEDAGGFKVRSFPSPRMSVRSFMKTLNTHKAYQNLREKRAELRALGRRPTGLALAPFLKSYSEIGQKYVRRVITTIRTNDLATFENLKIARQ